MLPAKLGIGMVSIYGAGSVQSMFSQTNNENILFGIVNQMYNQFSGVSIGSSVMYDKRDATPIFYIDQDYYLIPENKITLVETPLS